MYVEEERRIVGDPGTARLQARDAELQRLTEVVGSLADGTSGGCLIVEAPAGMGKTSLLSELARIASGARLQVASARGSLLESHFPYGVAIQLLEGPLSCIHASARDDLLAGPGAAAAQLFPWSRPRPSGDPAPADGYRVQAALHQVVAHLSRRRPLLLVADDIHWSDDPSLRFLAFLAHRIATLPAALVVAARPAAEWANRSLRLALVRDPTVLAIRPRALGVLAVEAFLASTTGMLVDAAFAEACRRVTGGNPFYLTELVRAVREQGIEPVSANVARLDALAPERVEMSVRERLDRLPSAATSVADALAVLGDETAPSRLAALSDLSLEETVAAADELRAVAVLSDSARPTFLHPVIRSAVYDALPAGRRALLHLRAAGLARERGAGAEVVAAHLLRTSADLDEGAGLDLQRAAAVALERGAPDVATVYLRRLLESQPCGLDRGSLLLELGRAEALARLPEAATRLADALEAADSGELRIRAALALWSADSFDGRFDEGLDVLRGARAASSDAGADALMRIDLEIARATRSARSTAAEGVSRIAALRSCGVAVSPGLDRVRCGLVAYDAMLANEPADQVLAQVEHAFPLSEEELERGGSQLLHLPIYTLIYCDALDRARQAIADVGRSAERRGAAIAAIVPLLWGCFVSIRAGDLSGAESLGTSALARSVEHSWHFGQAAARLWLADIAIERSDVTGARRFHSAIAETLRRAPELDDKGWVDHMLHGRALLELASGNVRSALAGLLEVGRRHDEFRATCPSELPWRSDAARCLRLAGDVDAARRMAGEEVELAETFGAPRALGVALQVEGVVTESEEALARAMAVLERSPARLELARARAELGALLRRRGRAEEARELLRRSMTEAMQLGATALVRQTSRELRAAGGTPPPRASLEAGELSSSELRVVRCAAQGLSNPEIARTLFVSRRTVEAHLYNAYRKLGISSRAELVDAFVP